ncbi:hypothetical protein [Georgenia subflava]|uniref:Uncharacterized protein n=1 Tax=Georgenia subflava TaxID=1622177 RepID=A0A6N7ELA9_9MICO|nr:hypothetical protein [Georgenia subflava]MPV36044.1 hypothetical protein [Georgenia subflava]
MASSRTSSRPHLPNSPFNAGRQAPQGEPIPVGAQVCHDRHGLGRVVALDGPNSVIVDFGHGNARRVDLNSPRIERL